MTNAELISALQRDLAEHGVREVRVIIGSGTIHATEVVHGPHCVWVGTDWRQPAMWGRR